MASFGTFPAYNTPAVLKAFTMNPALPAGVATALETGTLVAEMPPHPQSAAIDRTLQEEHNLIMTGQKTLDKGITDMEKRVKELLAE
jgi:multiple sugar transport system substrate-binding protein